jgi:carbon storage regulator CsrA
MLVLSRRPTQQLFFPSLQTTLKVLSIKAKTVRLGVEAPPEVVVLRGELRPQTEGPPVPAPGTEADRCNPRHSVRELLNNLVLGIALLRRQVGTGFDFGAHATLKKMDAELEALRRDLAALWDGRFDRISPLQMTGWAGD